MSTCCKKMDADDKKNDSSDEEESSLEDSSDEEESNSSDEEEQGENSEDSSDEAETGEQPIKVLSWNINGDNSAGFGRIRSDVVSKVVVHTKPDVILLQETYPVGTPKIIKFHTGNIRLYYTEAVGEGRKMSSTRTIIESQVLYNSSKYRQIGEEEKLFPLESDLDKESLRAVLERAKDKAFSAANDKLRQGSLENLKRVFNERISIVGLKIKHDEEPYEGPIMIFMSYHNVHKSKGADVRARAIEGFCQLVSELRKLTKCVVLAGADLNQQFVHPIDPTHKYPYPNILEYKPTPRRLKRGQIDYFILEPADCLKGQVTPWNFMKSVKHGALNELYIVQPAKLYKKKVTEQPSDDTLYETVTNKKTGIQTYRPYRIATIEDFDEMIPHDPLLCTFVVPGYVLKNAK